MEGFGRLLKFDLKVYVYPTVDPKTGELVTASDLRVEDPGVQKLYDYILERGAIVPVEHYDRELLRHGDVGWTGSRDEDSEGSSGGGGGGGESSSSDGGSKATTGAGSRKVEGGNGSGAGSGSSSSKSKAKAAPAA